MRSLILVVSVIALGGCLKSEKQESIEQAEDVVRYNMRDPDSTQFRNTSLCPGEETLVYGWYNAKNGYGAYNGFKVFFII